MFKSIVCCIIVTFSLLACVSATDDLVNVELHEMSRCPDCASFVSFFSDVYDDLKDILNVTLSFVVEINGNTTTCMHGPGECLGNEYELCVQWLEKDKSFDFLECADVNYASIPSNMEACAEKLDINWKKISSCQTQVGPKMLLKSGRYSQSKGVKWAPTIFLNDEKYCEWHGDCGSTTYSGWVKKICSLYTGSTKPKACSTA